MNKVDRSNIEKTAYIILRMAHELWKESMENGRDCWHKPGARQAYRDCLEAMKRNHLISDYCVPKNTLIL